MAAIPTTSGAPSEIKNSRITVDGRKLTYSLNVKQQPEQARACGQGAKSSSDRRPVDPPPIIELNVYEGDDMRDITFEHNADFFVIAWLENDRPIASGRTPQPSGSNMAIAGSGVAGISYLDRPVKAGYFIFPDLSIRHEGQYRLNFVLYERVKEARDVDSDHNSSTQYAEPVDEFVHARTSTKSEPFTVYSAKKFPGLKSSTQLSREVSEQGCRVRIRREARMRKREEKIDGDWDYENHEANRRALSGRKENHIPPPPSSQGHPYPNHPQNPSNPSQPNFASGPRPGDMHPPPPQDPASHAGVSPYGYGPPMDYAAPRMMQSDQYGYSAPSSMPQPPSTQSQYAFPQQSLAAQGQNYNGSYMGHERSSSATHPFADPSGPPLNPYDSQLHRGGPQQPPFGSTDGQSTYGSSDASSVYSRPSNMHGGSLSSNSTSSAISPQQRDPGEVSMPPLITNGFSDQSDFSKSSGVPSPMSAPATGRPSTSNSAYSNMPQSAHTNTTPTLPRIMPTNQQFFPPDNGIGSKRTFGTVFNTQHTEQPMRAGARPQLEGDNANYDVAFPTPADLDWQEVETLRFSYRRADGRMQTLYPSIPKRQ